MQLQSFLVLLVAFTVQSCSPPKNADVNEVIDRLDKLSYSSMLNKSVVLVGRGRNANEDMIYVSDFNNSCGPYIVYYSFKKHQVLAIENHLVLDFCPQDVFEEHEIIAAVRACLGIWPSS